MTQNIFVPALEPEQRHELETVRHAEAYTFHELLDVETLVAPHHVDFPRLLEQARRELDAFPGSVDAIIAQWDFPTSVLVPILCAERGIPSPSLRSVLASEHKYWSRLIQRECVPEHTPRFHAFDPFDDSARAQIDLAFPFWVKPVKGFSSQLGFRIDNEQDFRVALEKLREGVSHLGDAFDEALAMVELPEELRRFKGTACIAEECISGRQIAPEGCVFQGQFQVHGVVDMDKDESGKSLDKLIYPSTAPKDLQERMNRACERYLKAAGFDNGCFNAEFMYDEPADKLWLVEVNTRISQSHSEMFVQVDGMSNHEIAIDVALGQRPRLSSEQGPYRIAAKCPIPWYGDGIVRRVPEAREIAAVKERFPLADIRIEVQPGQRLSELPNQDSYRFLLGVIYLGAQDRQELDARFEECLRMLSFEIEPLRDKQTA